MRRTLSSRPASAVVRAALGLATAIALAAPAALAGPRWEKGDASFELSGSLRLFGLYSKQTDLDDFAAAAAEDVLGGNDRCLQAATFEDCPSFDEVGETPSGQALTRLRIEADMRATKWLSAVVIYDNEVVAGTLDTFEANLANALADRSFIGAEGTILEGEHVEWRHRLYRAYLEVEAKGVEARVGRMRVAWGVGKLWNPIDRFSALPPLALQPDITPGIDGFDVRYNLDGFSYLQVVFAPARDMDDMRVAGRVHGVLFDTDLSLMGGVFEEAPVVGIDFARNAFGAAFGFELVYTHPTREVWPIEDAEPSVLDDYFQLVVNADRTFDVGTGLYVLVEYLYNGNALGFGSGRAGALLPLFEATDVPPDVLPGPIPGPYPTIGSVDLFGSSRVISNAAHQIGMDVGYDLTPELRGDFVTVVDIDGGSAAFFPNLAWSPLDWMEVATGVQLFAGPKRSQFGAQKPLVYGQVDLFF